MRNKAESMHRGLAGVLKYEKVRFMLVGAVNTAVDFAVLLILSIVLGIPATLSNIVSTSCALAVSYVLNKKAVFGDADPNNRRQIILFVGVTLVGLWVIQGAIIIWLNSWFEALAPQLSLPFALMISKAIATIASLIWNYMWYSRVVFRKERK